MLIVGPFHERPALFVTIHHLFSTNQMTYKLIILLIGAPNAIYKISIQLEKLTAMKCKSAKYRMMTEVYTDED